MADVFPLGEHLHSDLSTQRKTADGQNLSAETGIDIGNQSGGIFLNGGKGRGAVRVAVQHRKHHMILLRKFLGRHPIVPPRQSAAMEKQDHIYILLSIFLYQSFGCNL